MINTCTISGYVGREPVVAYTKDQKPVLDFAFAYSKGKGDNKQTSWFNCKIYGQRALSMEQYIHKGMLLTVSGEVLVDSWKDKTTGKMTSKIILIVDQVQFPPKTYTKTTNDNEIPLAPDWVRN